MNKLLQPLALACTLFFSGTMSGQEIVSIDTTHTQTPEAHLFATFVKTFDNNLSLTFEEEIRSAPSHRSHTTIALGYTPIPYLNIYAGYTLKLYGNQGWDDPNKFLRHRANILFTGQVKLGQWALSLREGVMLDARADEVDKRCKNTVDFTLRSRLQAVYSIPKTPLAIVAKMEMLNTLNAPVAYINSLATTTTTPHNTTATPHYGQYISELRPELGMQWKINKQHSLSLSYRYNYLYDRDISIDDSTGDVSLTHKYTTKHLILLAYKFGW